MGYRGGAEIADSLQMIEIVEHRPGFEPGNTGFADQRVNHFAIGAS